MDQGQDTLRSILDNTEVIARKAWTAYIGVTLLAVFGCIFLSTALGVQSLAAGVICFLLVGGYSVYRVLELRSHLLLINEVGIWHVRGILPWTRGYSGVKWRDLEEASFVQGFTSWLFRSHSLRIGHRFTKSSEILMHHMKSAPGAVERVNRELQILVREGKLN